MTNGRRTSNDNKNSQCTYGSGYFAKAAEEVKEVKPYIVF